MMSKLPKPQSKLLMKLWKCKFSMSNFRKEILKFSYLPVIMAQAKIYWDKGNYAQVEKIFRYEDRENTKKSEVVESRSNSVASTTHGV